MKFARKNLSIILRDRINLKCKWVYLSKQSAAVKHTQTDLKK